MKLAHCAIALFAVTTCSAQQSNLLPWTPNYRIAEAKTISIEELQQRSQSKARGVFEDAKIAAQQGDHAHAIKLFEKVLKIDPVFSDARNDLAVELIVSGQTERAMEQLRYLMQITPHFMMAYTNLGAILCHQKKYADAEAVLRRALTVDANSPRANLLLAISLHEQGRHGAETRNALETAAKTNPVATKLLKTWYASSEIAEEDEPADTPKTR